MTKTAEQMEALFDAARQLTSPAARRTFLDEACAGDATLRARVEALLSAQSDADKFFSEIAPFASTPPPGAGNSAAGTGSPATGTPAEASVPIAAIAAIVATSRTARIPLIRARSASERP